MPNSVQIGSGRVDITADMTNFDNAMAALPKKAADRMGAAMQSLQSKVAQTAIELKVAYNKGDLAEQQRLIPILDNLKAKVDAVTHAATGQAQAMQDAARAQVAAQEQVAAAHRQAAEAAKQAAAAQVKGAQDANAYAAQQLAMQEQLLAATRAVGQAHAQTAAKEASDIAAFNSMTAPRGPRDPRAVDIPDYSKLTKNGQIDYDALDKLGKAGQRAGEQVRQGGMNGAMGLMILSQSIDDIQYGFQAIVNNIPMLGMAMGPMLGMSTQAAMKFGAIAGIAAVAINVIISHWDQMFQRFGYGTDAMKTVWEQFFGETKKTGIDAIDAIEARIKELQDKPIKLAVDTFELERAKEKLKELKEARDAFEHFGKKGNAFEQQSGQQVAGALGSLGHQEAQRLKDVMTSQRAAQIAATAPAVLRENLTPEEEAAIRLEARQKAAGGMFGGFGAGKGVPGGAAPANPEAEAAALAAERERRRNAAFEARNNAAPKQAADEIGAMLAKAQKGTDLQAQKDLAKALRGAGREDLARKVEEAKAAKVAPGFATAEEQREQEGYEAKGRAHGRAYDLEQQKLGMSLEAEGRRNQSDYFAQRKEESDRQAARFATALAPALSGDVVLGKISDKDLAKQIKSQMEGAGIDAMTIADTLAETMRKLKEDLKDRVRDKIAGGLSREQAEFAVAQEDRERKKSLTGNRPKVQSTEEYLRQFLVAGGKPSEDIRGLSEQQLEQQRNMTQILEEINQTLEKKEEARAARFGSARR